MGKPDNLIPMDLALKMASKIRAKERFAVHFYTFELAIVHDKMLRDLQLRMAILLPLLLLSFNIDMTMISEAFKFQRFMIYRPCKGNDSG
ncbi:hypothetical protein NC653_018155 [Populus alba x Populus x berolinensis]|uniref:Uncharacterized protein n=1 Tax=Populus alba x Populus x berolinensis TaxID=444605 RepID=A0AAD6QFT0_9ROSI|nr:hypothetical protein NC653_018155 [Populus alba x Populus x berolinensis]